MPELHTAPALSRFAAFFHYMAREGATIWDIFLTERLLPSKKQDQFRPVVVELVLGIVVSVLFWAIWPNDQSLRSNWSI